jgi:glycosyltransferase involved in cell wall biosynthesis
MKGHGETIEAAAALAARWPDAVWLLAGRDESAGRYAAQARERGVERQIRFLGFYPGGREILRAADLFILPSHYEGCPISILEAMAERRPIIASRVGGIPEQVTDGVEALLIPPADAGALADAIDRLWRDGAMRVKLIEAARRRVEREFGRERMIERYSRLYRNLAAGMWPPRLSNGDDPQP